MKDRTGVARSGSTWYNGADRRLDQGGDRVANVTYQPTPNPNSLKFVLDRPVVEAGSESYMNAEDAKGSPVASALFAIEGVAGVFMLGNFVTVTKAPEASWEDLVPQVEQVLSEQFA